MGAFNEGWNVLKDFWMGGDSGLAGLYVPPAYKLPDSWKQGDKITADMFEGMPQPWSAENDMFDRPVNETTSYDPETHEPYLHGSSRPRPLEHNPNNSLQVIKPISGAVNFKDEERANIEPSEDWAGVNLGNHSMKTYIGDEDDNDGWDWDKPSNFEPNLPQILQTLLHENAHRATAEEIEGMTNAGHIKGDFRTWAHEFAANSLQRPGGSHDKDIESPERSLAHRDSVMYRPFKLVNGSNSSDISPELAEQVESDVENWKRRND